MEPVPAASAPEPLSVAEVAREPAPEREAARLPALAAASAGASPSRASRRLRSDAAVNRDRLLTAAVAAMIREGQNVPLATIAADANVGVGTLYRRYPNREALLDALQLRAYSIVLSSLDDVLARDASGLRSIELFLERTIVTRSDLVLPMHGAPETTNPEAVRARGDVALRVGRLLERGVADGSVRASVTPDDVIVFGAMIAQQLPNVPEWSIVARAQVQIFLGGIAAPE
ncbi:TetR/AcrR family transcriptional regulator [Subtercola lobariae]|uniref:TetR family transcriptional regulator n=1 Tax=Subtercola lobariae TaxID=1588641 RepID=A0A917B1I0_9MICO|nr:TetR/AcrR family transcriptional regulator [Subtercola lobariae]GGF14766.1 TetR family transcriptional regulator [Subtercola lobariae]